MILTQHYLGCLSHASYVIGDETTGRAVVVDPRRDIEVYLEEATSRGLTIERVIDSLQLTAKHRVSTPVNWKQGEDVIIAGSVSNDEAKQIFGDWKEPKPYIRIVPQPS